MENLQPTMLSSGYTLISMTGDTTPVTANCTVNFAATVPDGSEPDLELSFYEIQGLPDESDPPTQRIDMERVTIAQTPSVVWHNGVAEFSVVMDDSVFDQLRSKHTHFGVAARISGKPSWGMSTFVVDLSDK